ncbi:MAG: hypothetical protein LBC03_03455 [Nitrososphaerota archaeon]|nr:hypothetical protein [Nitrososphaerota archaeon]
MDNFTVKSQEAIQKASEIAAAKQNQAIELAHLLKAILVVDENVMPYLLTKLNVNVDYFTNQLDKLIDALPKVVGGQPYLASNFNKTLQKAQEYTGAVKDEFISLEQLLLAVLSLNP